MVAGSVKCVKYTLFLFNLIFSISGLALIITGAVIQARYSSYLDFLGDKFFNTPVLLIVVGCIIFFVAFFGCCGAIKEHYCMTVCFAFLLAIIFLLEIGASIAAYQLKSEVNTIIEVNMEEGMKNYNMTGYQGVTETWNMVQQTLECCGTQTYKDWENTTFSMNGTNVPDSCCLTEVAGCGVGMLTAVNVTDTIHTDGCFTSFSENIKENIEIIGGVGIGIAFIQFIGLVFACCLARSIKREYETV